MMAAIPMVIGGIVSVLTTRGFVSGIKRETWERPSFSEWLLGAGVGLLTGVMVATLLRGIL